MVRNNVKSIDYQVREGIKKINEEDLRWLSVRLKERIGGDFCESLMLIHDEYPELNKIFTNTQGSEGVYDVADAMERGIQEEIKRRNRPIK